VKHTLATSEEGREREVQLEKPPPGLATPDLVISQAEVERRDGASVDSDHDLLVGNSGVISTSTRRGMGHGATRWSRRGGDGARRGSTRDEGAVVRWFGAGGRRGMPRRAKGGLGISLGCRSVNEVDSGERVNGPVGPGRRAGSEMGMGCPD
jgi:hypothetical protein